MRVSSEAWAEVESALDVLVEQFAQLVLLHRNAGRDERELAILFDRSISGDSLPPDVVAEIKSKACAKLNVRLDKIMAQVLQPETSALH